MIKLFLFIFAFELIQNKKEMESYINLLPDDLILLIIEILDKSRVNETLSESIGNFSTALLTKQNNIN